MTTMESEGALAFNQEWFLMLEGARRHAGLPPPSAAFPLVFRLRGPWDRGVLDETLQTLATRHHVLRTAYGPTDRYTSVHHEMLLRIFLRHGVFVPGTFVRRTRRSSHIAIVERDAGTASVDALVASAMAEPLASGSPPVRAAVFHLDVDTRVLVLVASHLVCDGWSIGVLVRDLLKTHRAVVAGDATDLPPIDVDYDQFADEQHRAHRSGAFAAEEAYWHQQWSGLNGGAIRHAEIPFARHAARPQAPAMGSEVLLFTPAASNTIRQMVRRLRVTPYILFRTAMTLALSATLGKRRVAYWANFANRRAGLEHLVGWCANTHIVTIDVPETGTVAAMCLQVATAIRDARHHEAMPLASLWQRIGTNLDSYDTRVNFDIWPAGRPAAARPPEPIEVLSHSWLVSMDLDVRFVDDGQSFGLRGTYNGGRYEAAGVAAFVSTTAAIATRIAEYPSETPYACIRAAADGRSGRGEFASA